MGIRSLTVCVFHFILGPLSPNPQNYPHLQRHLLTCDAVRCGRTAVFTIVGHFGTILMFGFGLKPLLERNPVGLVPPGASCVGLTNDINQQKPYNRHITGRRLTHKVMGQPLWRPSWKYCGIVSIFCFFRFHFPQFSVFFDVLYLSPLRTTPPPPLTHQLQSGICCHQLSN